MKISRALWRLTTLVLVLLTFGIGLPASAAGPAFPIDAVRIPLQENARPVPGFIGHEATPNPITAPAIPQNPYMVTT